MKLLGIICFITLAIVVNTNKLRNRFQWKQVEFNFTSEKHKQAAIHCGEYVPENNLPLGLARWRNKMFITVPRWKNGVASTLNYVNLDNKDVSPKLIPYPGWRENFAPTRNCKNNVCKQNTTVVSSFRVQVDQCNRLWVMDTGMVDINGAAQQVTGNAILIFDLETDQLIRRYSIPSEQILDATFLPNIAIDMDDSDCSNAYAYLADLGGYGLIVYSFKNNESYRVNHHFFHFNPLYGDFNVNGINFQWTDGVFAVAVGPSNQDLSKDIYFHAFASADEFKVSNRVLQNKTLATDPNNYHLFKHVGSRGRRGQSSCEVYDKKTGVIFYNEVIKNSISCWNVRTEYKSRNLGLVEKNRITLNFINDMKLDDDGNLWVLSDRMPAFLNGQLNSSDINFRVMVAKTEDLIEDTRCHPDADRRHW